MRVEGGYIQFSGDGKTWKNVIALADLKGPKGDKGDNGPQGPAGAGMDVTGATVGQIAVVAAVDDNGVPTAWKPVDMPSGGGKTWETINTIALESGVVQYVLAQALTYKKVRLRIRKSYVNTGAGNGWIGIYEGSKNLARFMFDAGAVKSGRADVEIDMSDGLQMGLSYGNNLLVSNMFQQTARIPLKSTLTANSVLRLDIDESYTEAFDGTGSILVEGVRR